MVYKHNLFTKQYSTSIRFGIGLVSLWFMFCSSIIFAQIESSIPVKQNSTNVNNIAIEIPDDVLGRRSPQGTVSGYIDAMADEDYHRAAQYFNLRKFSQKQVEQKGPELAKNLKYFLDKNGSLEPIALISDEPDGNKNDELEYNLEKIGYFKYKEQLVNVVLEKLDDQNGDKVWLVSANTIKQIPLELDNKVTSILNSFLPRAFLDNKIIGVSIGHWFALVIIFIIATLISWAISKLTICLVKFIWKTVYTEQYSKIVNAFFIPIQIYFTIWLFVYGIKQIGISIIARQYISTATLIISWVAILILIWELVGVFGNFAEKRALRRQNYGALSAIMFFRRSMKFILFFTGVVFALDVFGVNVTAGIAALGIGGIAIALGAQKTVENIVGSLTLIADRPVRVGDLCKVGDIFGVVEQIGIRSTRIRTFGRTLVTIPNGDFSSEKIENYTHRDFFWYHQVLNFRYETSPDQIRYLLVKLRGLLHAHPRVNNDMVDTRVRFLEYGRDSLNIQIFAYIRATKYEEFLEIKEDINLHIMDIVANSGAQFAFPSQTLYMARDNAISEQSIINTENIVQDWKEHNKLHLPNYDPASINEIRNTIEYPSKSSSWHNEKK